MADGEREIDLIDVVAIALIPITGAMVLGVWTFQLTVFGGYDIARTLYAYGDVEFTVPLFLTVGGFAWIFGTNSINRESYSKEEFAAVVIGMGLPILYELVPFIAALIELHDVIRLAAAFAVAIAATYASYVR